MAGRSGKRLRAVLSALLLLFAVNVSHAEESDPFVVRSAEFTLDQSLMMLDLAIDSNIPDYISIAIEQGFSVPIMFEVEIRSHKRFWFDPRVVSLKQQYLLHHQPMLNSYVVFDVNNSERRYFDDRDAGRKARSRKPRLPELWSTTRTLQSCARSGVNRSP
jgi:hypothetical protein